MTVLIIYTMFSYLFILGGLIQIEKKFNFTSFTTFLFAPFFFPVFLGMYFFEKHNKKCNCISSQKTNNSH